MRWKEDKHGAFVGRQVPHRNALLLRRRPKPKQFRTAMGLVVEVIFTNKHQVEQWNASPVSVFNLYRKDGPMIPTPARDNQTIDSAGFPRYFCSFSHRDFGLPSYLMMRGIEHALFQALSTAIVMPQTWRRDSDPNLRSSRSQTRLDPKQNFARLVSRNPGFYAANRLHPNLAREHGDVL